MGGARFKVVEVVIVVIVHEWCCGEPMTILLSVSDWLWISRTSTEGQSSTPWGVSQPLRKPVLNLLESMFFEEEELHHTFVRNLRAEGQLQICKRCSEKLGQIGDPIDGPARYSVVRRPHKLG